MQLLIEDLYIHIQSNLYDRYTLISEIKAERQRHPLTQAHTHPHTRYICSQSPRRQAWQQHCAEDRPSAA